MGLEVLLILLAKLGILINILINYLLSLSVLLPYWNVGGISAISVPWGSSLRVGLSRMQSVFDPEQRQIT